MSFSRPVFGTKAGWMPWASVIFVKDIVESGWGSAGVQFDLQMTGLFLLFVAFVFVVLLFFGFYFCFF